MAAATVVEAVRVDQKGRVALPKRARQHLGIKPGDILALVTAPDVRGARLAKVVNAFDVLAVEAIALDARGETISDADLLERLELDPAALPLEIIDDPE